jgi:hypothetical protein
MQNQTDLQILQSGMHRVKDTLHRSVRKGTLLNLLHHKKPLKMKHVEFKNTPKFICAPGSVFKGSTCVKCPVGTYFDMTTGSCESCPIGHYQPLEGSIVCLTCPPGTSTRRTHAKNIHECRRKCILMLASSLFIFYAVCVWSFM